MMLKILYGIVCLLVLLYSFVPCSAEQSGVQNLFLIWDERGKYGYIDATGRVVIKPQYDGALPFTEGLAAVSVGKKWGFIDSSGKVIVPLSYRAVSTFSDGVAAVTLEADNPLYPCGYIDHTGKFVIKPQNEFSCKDFNEGFAVISLYDSQIGESLDGYINKEGEIIARGKLRADPFSEGWALVISIDGSSEFISGKGKSPLNLRGYGGRVSLFSDLYEPVGPFSEGLAEVGFKTYGGSYSLFGFMNDKGEVVIKLPEKMRVEGPFQNGRALIHQEKTEDVKVRLGNGETITQGVDASAYGYIDNTGRVVIPARFSEAEGFFDRLAAVKAGKLQPSNRRDIIGSAAESSFSDEGGRWVCINQAGKVVIEKCGEPLSREELTEKFPQFGKGFGKGFTNGLFFNKLFVADGREARKAVYGYMNKNGKYVWIQPHGQNVVRPRWWRENFTLPD